MSETPLTNMLSHVLEYHKVLTRIVQIYSDQSQPDYKKKLDFLTRFSYFNPDFSAVIDNYQHADQEFQNLIQDAINKNHKRIKRLSQEYQVHSDQIAETHYRRPCDLQFTGSWPKSALTRNIVMNKCQGHSSWTFPGLIFRPQVCEFLRSVVACDPLYLCDHDINYVRHVETLFPEEYRLRLRYYTVDESRTAILDHLPQENFGFIAAFNFFNTKNLTRMQRYFTEIFHLLRPGGIFGFSFNDCDHSHEVNLVERRLECYTPGNQVKQLLKDLGFYIILQHRDLGGSSWWEAQRPGEINSIRGSQTLARILTV
jgi:SAM-dependent methyltransferase